MKKIQIFTFWEPSNKIPHYIKLCMETWKKLSDKCEIVVLDYKSLPHYLEKKYPNILYKKYSLPMQADAIRCAILKKYGGLWLDADTIIVNSNFKRHINYQSNLTLVGHHIGFIVAKSDSYILKKWYKSIYVRLYLCKIISPLLIFPKITKKIFNRWNYLGNGIIDKYLLKSSNSEFNMLPENNEVFPENTSLNSKLNPNSTQKNYENFYFSQTPSPYVIKSIVNNNKYGFVCLHNSWTPNKYKNMPKNDFLSQDIILSKLLNYVLENSSL